MDLLSDCGVTLSYETIRSWRQNFEPTSARALRWRDWKAAKRFFRKILKHQGRPPSQFVTDKLGCYVVARREVGLSASHRTGQYKKNRDEASHQHARERERQMPRF